MKTLNLRQHGGALSDIIENAVQKISDSFNFGSSDQSTLIDKTIYDILDNQEDKKKFEDAVEYLKVHRDVKNKEIHLSNKTIIISLE